VIDITYKDAYPYPGLMLQYIRLESLSGSTIFTMLDLASGYWQIELEEASKEKTAFSTAGGHYKFNIMPFGHMNTSAHSKG
jgi:hypothetical protein